MEVEHPRGAVIDVLGDGHGAIATADFVDPQRRALLDDGAALARPPRTGFLVDNRARRSGPEHLSRVAIVRRRGDRRACQRRRQGVITITGHQRGEEVGGVVHDVRRLRRSRHGRRESDRVAGIHRGAQPVGTIETDEVVRAHGRAADRVASVSVTVAAQPLPPRQRDRAGAAPAAVAHSQRVTDARHTANDGPADIERRALPDGGSEIGEVGRAAAAHTNVRTDIRRAEDQRRAVHAARCRDTLLGCTSSAATDRSHPSGMRRLPPA